MVQRVVGRLIAPTRHRFRPDICLSLLRCMNSHCKESTRVLPIKMHQGLWRLKQVEYFIRVTQEVQQVPIRFFLPVETRCSRQYIRVHPLRLTLTQTVHNGDPIWTIRSKRILPQWQESYQTVWHGLVVFLDQPIHRQIPTTCLAPEFGEWH